MYLLGKIKKKKNIFFKKKIKTGSLPSIETFYFVFTVFTIIILLCICILL